MRKKFGSGIKFITLLLLVTKLSAQNIGIGTISPHSSAQLDITSTSKGFLIPRMTTSVITSISNPAKGLMVYDSTKNQLMVNMGISSAPNWQTIVANSGWNLTGNSGINAATQFIGTTDATSLLFRVNNQPAGFIHYGNLNTAFGLQALTNNTTGNFNTANGRGALYYNNTGGGNTAIGANALYYNTSGSFNIAIGSYILYANSTGNYNTAIGSDALVSNSSGNYNTAIGNDALYWNTTGSNNIANGGGSLYNNSSGQENVAIGTGALYSNSGSLAHYNTAIGSYALANTTNSQYNTAIGYRAGDNYDMGYNNTILGANCDVNAYGLYNCIAIGQAVTCTASSQARIGNSATNSIGGYANWTNFSDGRYKKNIQQNVQGLDFIMKLRPVTYQLDVSGISKILDEGRGKELNVAMKTSITEKEQMIFSGFIAQEVEQAAKETNYNFSGVDKPKNEKDFYGLRYADFVVPMVKAMQEQQQLIGDLQKRISLLEEQNKMLMQLLNKKN
jgi:hypothetical protein